MVVVVAAVMVAAAAVVVVWWWLLCVVGSLHFNAPPLSGGIGSRQQKQRHFNALEHAPPAPKGKRLGQRACIGRVAQGQRGGGKRVLDVFENWAGKCVCLI